MQLCWTLYCKCTNFQANHNWYDYLSSLDEVGLYIANVLTFKRITTEVWQASKSSSWTLYCKCTNFQANHNNFAVNGAKHSVGLYIANVLTFKRITTDRRSWRFFRRWTLYCKCTNFQANHNVVLLIYIVLIVGLYIANVLTFKRITTNLCFV